MINAKKVAGLVCIFMIFSLVLTSCINGVEISKVEEDGISDETPAPSNAVDNADAKQLAAGEPADDLSILPAPTGIVGQNYTIDRIEDIALPPLINDYAPELQYTPLFEFGDPNSGFVYSIQRHGEEGVQKQIFADRNGNLFHLPDDAVKYTFYGIFYGVYNDEGLMAVMNLNGEVLTDYIYYDIKTNEAGYNYVDSWANYIVLQKMDTEKDIDGKEQYLSGLFDIETGQECAPFIFDDIFVRCGYFVAYDKTGDSLKIIDSGGMVWYDMGTNDYLVHDAAVYGSGGFITSPGEKYLFLGDQKAVYLTFTEDSALHVANKLFGAATGRTADGLVYDIYTFNGEFIAEGIYRTALDTASGAVLLSGKDNFLVVASEGTTEIPDRFTTPGSRNPGGFRITEEGNYEIRLYRSPELDRLVTIDIDGMVLSDVENEIDYSRVNGFFKDDSGYHPISNPSKTYPIAFNCDAFVYACSNYDYDKPMDTQIIEQDIYDEMGNLLLQNIMAVTISYSESFMDQIVVFVDAETCGFLYADGRFERINGVPKVAFVVGYN